MKRSVLLATTALLVMGAAGAAHADPFCREYTSNVTVGNRVQQSVGTACLNPDGSWQIVSGDNVGASFYDNGPAGYGTNNVTYVQPAPVYVAPPNPRYVLRDRVYYPSSSTVIINGYGYGNHWKRPRNVYRPYYMAYDNRGPRGWGHGHDHHDHDRGGRGRH